MPRYPRAVSCSRRIAESILNHIRKVMGISAHEMGEKQFLRKFSRGKNVAPPAGNWMENASWNWFLSIIGRWHSRDDIEFAVEMVFQAG